MHVNDRNASSRGSLNTNPNLGRNSSFQAPVSNTSQSKRYVNNFVATQSNKSELLKFLVMKKENRKNQNYHNQQNINVIHKSLENEITGIREPTKDEIFKSQEKHK